MIDNLDYVVQAGVATLAIFSGYIMHKVRQKELRLDDMENRIVLVEKHNAVQTSQLTDIRHRLKDVQETLTLLVSQHLK